MFEDLETPRTEGELSQIRLKQVDFHERHFGPISEYTCDGCGHRYVCVFVFDGYNTDGDCLATK